MITIVPHCQKCDSHLEVSDVQVSIEGDCSILAFSTTCVECGAEWSFDWTLESLVKWAYENYHPKERAQSTGSLVAERAGLTH